MADGTLNGALWDALETYMSLAATAFREDVGNENAALNAMYMSAVAGQVALYAEFTQHLPADQVKKGLNVAAQAIITDTHSTK